MDETAKVSLIIKTDNGGYISYIQLVVIELRKLILSHL